MLNINHSLRARNLRGPSFRKVRGIVLHDTAGAGTVGDVGYLANDPEHRGISVDFVVTRDGVAWQLNPDPHKYYTFHAGRHTKFRDMINGSVNAGTIGIEISHKSNPALQSPEWPTEQVMAVAQLCKQLCDEFHLTAEDITTHAKIITDRSRTDPRNFPFSQFWAIFNGDNDPVLVVPPVQPVTVSNNTYIAVVAGDTLWDLAQKYQTSIETLKGLNNLTGSLLTVGQKLRVK